MKTEYRYIEFRRIESKRKTSVWSCHNIKSGDELAIIKWHGAWRQYCFFPMGPAVYSKGCLADIWDFISQLMAERRQPKKDKTMVAIELRSSEHETAPPISGPYRD